MNIPGFDKTKNEHKNDMILEWVFGKINYTVEKNLYFYVESYTIALMELVHIVLHIMIEIIHDKKRESIKKAFTALLLCVEIKHNNYTDGFNNSSKTKLVSGKWIMK